MTRRNLTVVVVAILPQRARREHEELVACMRQNPGTMSWGLGDVRAILTSGLDILVYCSVDSRSLSVLVLYMESLSRAGALCT